MLSEILRPCMSPWKTNIYTGTLWEPLTATTVIRWHGLDKVNILWFFRQMKLYWSQTITTRWSTQPIIIKKRKRIYSDTYVLVRNNAYIWLPEQGTSKQRWGCCLPRKLSLLADWLQFLWPVHFGAAKWNSRDAVTCLCISWQALCHPQRAEHPLSSVPQLCFQFRMSPVCHMLIQHIHMIQWDHIFATPFEFTQKWSSFFIPWN